jgi:flagellum-specific peptidoglycan hydrolase FlgJ
MHPDRLKFLQLMCPALLDAGVKYNIPRAVLICGAVQGGIETSVEDPTTKGYFWGLSDLFTKGWNFGGMQQFSPLPDFPPPIVRNSSEFVNGVRVPRVEKFRQFTCLADAILAWWGIVQGYRYQAFGLLKYATDTTLTLTQQVHEVASCLQRGGYSSSPQYASTIVEIAGECNLLADNGLEQYVSTS